MGEAVIIDALRTPIGRYGGALKDVRPDDLAALVMRALLDRNPDLDSAEVDDVIFGCTNQAGEDNRNVARMSLLLAGLPITVPGVTVNRLCGSGLEAVNQAAHAIMADVGSIYLTGGVESMTRAPQVMPKSAEAFQRSAEIHDTTIGWRLINPRLRELYFPYSMGETAENVAERYGVSREDQDAFAVQSQSRAATAIEAGHFRDEIEPVSVPQRKGDPILVTQDEHPRPGTTMEDLARLKPAFKAGGTVTAGNCSGINDGAAALLVMDRSRAERSGLKSVARIVMTAASGVDPAYMGIGPVDACRKLAGKAGIDLQAVDLFELNEAFASQSVACIRELGLDPVRVNVLGGAIALGHPLGCSGARILTTLVHELRRRGGHYGIATMCIGVGQGIATLIERT